MYKSQVYFQIKNMVNLLKKKPKSIIQNSGQCIRQWDVSFRFYRHMSRLQIQCMPHTNRNGMDLIIEMRTPNFIRTLCSGSCFRMMWYKIKIIDVSSTKYGVLKPTLQRIRRKFQSGRVFFFLRKKYDSCDSSADIKILENGRLISLRKGIKTIENPRNSSLQN